MDFEDIPFSELESRLLIATGAWKSYQEIEELLTLDELLLTLEALRRHNKDQLRMLASVQGIELPEDEEDIADIGDDDLPEELLEMERKFNEKRQAKKDDPEGFNEFSLGHEISPFPINVATL